MIRIAAGVVIARVVDWGAVDWDGGSGRIGSSRGCRGVCSYELMGGPG